MIKNNFTFKFFAAMFFFWGNTIFAQKYNCITTQYSVKVNTSTQIDTCAKEITVNVSYSGNPIYLYWSDGYVGGSRKINYSGSYQLMAFDSSWCADTSKTIYVNLNDNYLNVSGFPNNDDIKTCKGQFVNLYCYATGKFKWNTGDTTSNLFIEKSGNYFATMTSKNGCRDTSNVIKVTFVEFSSIKIKNLTDTIVCSGDSVGLELVSNLSGYKYYWSPYYQNVKKINAKYSGIYYVYAYDSATGCGGYSNKINVLVKTAPLQNLCMVSVDSATGRNKLIWKKNSGAGIVSYNIYKESNFAGEFDLIGSQSFGSPSFFIDSISNPKQRPFTYYITAVDSCDGESEYSKYYAHTTLHLTASLGVSGENNLNWSNYLGLYPINTYVIYRSNKGSSFQPIGSVAASINSYSDLNPPSGSNRYFIGIKATTECMDSSQIIYSNMVAFGILSNKEQNFDNVSLYPNPAQTSIQLSNIPQNSKISIYNIQGQVMIDKISSDENPIIDIQHLASGIYTVKINNIKTLKFAKTN